MTIMVKVLVYPATWKTYMSSAKMRVLKPKVDEIGKKYPKQEDAMKKQQEVMALYSQYGVSPMGGCLPMLIQFPILMALFMFVPSAIELRQQSFLWADDLSTYDAFINFPFHIPFLGSHLSLFCLLMTVTNILNTKFTMQQQDTGAQPANGSDEMDVVPDARDVPVYIERLSFGTELLLLHFDACQCGNYDHHAAKRRTRKRFWHNWKRTRKTRRK